MASNGTMGILTRHNAGGILKSSLTPLQTKLFNKLKRDGKLKTAGKDKKTKEVKYQLKKKAEDELRG